MKRILNIAQIGAPVLRESTKRLKREELLSPQIQKFIEDLIHTMRSANEAGLAANQAMGMPTDRQAINWPAFQKITQPTDRHAGWSVGQPPGQLGD